MKYYYRQNIARYEKMRRMGVEAWARDTYGGTDYGDFSSRQFLDDVVPRIRRRTWISGIIGGRRSRTNSTGVASTGTTRTASSTLEWPPLRAVHLRG